MSAARPGASSSESSSLPQHQPGLQFLVGRAVQKTLAHFAEQKLTAEQLAVTVVDLRNPSQPAQASYRGDVQIYPASIIKLFYLVAAHRWMEDGTLADTEELRRAMSDMIVLSYNEATGYIVDLLTGTTSGPELSPAEIETWQHKRNAVNRYFSSLGYTNINVNKKPWCEGPYGRETQAIQLFQPKRNWLTTDATARLMAEIVTGKLVSAARCSRMMDVLQRDYSNPANDNTQARAYTGAAMPPGGKLWSKAGWMSEVRHDAAYVELPGGARFVLVIFTVGHADRHDIIPALARALLEGMSPAQ